jgi:hypothetical protein
VTGLDLVQANYWYWDAKGDMQWERPAGLMARGSLAAIMWLSGQSPFPACYQAPLPRTRANLLKLLRYSEMVLTDEGEQVDREDGAVNIIDRYGHAGARAVYQWALGMTDELPGSTLMPEEIREARRHYAAQRARPSSAA